MDKHPSFRRLADVSRYQVESRGRLASATHEEIRNGATADIYFVKTYEILEHLDLLDTDVVAEIFPSRPGILAGMNEVLELLTDAKVSVQGLEEGESFGRKEVILRIQGPYSQFGLYETAILGILASASAWATAAREVKEAAGEIPVICFGSRHLHPAVAPVMERAALVGGMDGASNILGAKLLGRQPAGTIPHAVILVAGDTVRVAEVYDRIMPAGESRVVLVDTFHDEAEESLRVARVLGERLGAVRLDTPSERGGVTAGLVEEIRARLDQAGFGHVGIFVSGGVTPERIPELIAAGASGLGVGSYVSGARPIDMTMDLKQIDGRPIAKRGRIPGITENPRLQELQIPT